MRFCERDVSIRYPTWKKNMVIYFSVSKLRVREKRLIFHVIRSADDITHDSFFPAFGLTAGEFCTWHILADGCRRKKK